MILNGTVERQQSVSNENDKLNLIKSKSNNPSGRPKGLPNGDHKELFEMCRKRNIDVFEECLNDIESGDQKARSSAIKIAMDFLYAKRKAIEVTGDVDVTIGQQQLIDLKAQVLALRNMK